MRAQLEGDVELLSPILCTSGRVRYAFVERSRIAKAFFDPPSTRGAEGDVDCRVSIVDDMVSLCIRQEGMFRKARRIRRIQARESEFFRGDLLVGFLGIFHRAQPPHFY